MVWPILETHTYSMPYKASTSLKPSLEPQTALKDLGQLQKLNDSDLLEKTLKLSWWNEPLGRWGSVGLTMPGWPSLTLVQAKFEGEKRRRKGCQIISVARMNVIIAFVL